MVFLCPLLPLSVKHKVSSWNSLKCSNDDSREHYSKNQRTNEEIEIINNYMKSDSKDTILLDDLVKELGLNE